MTPYQRLYRELKAHQICVSCKRNEPMPGKVQCAYCAENQAENTLKRHQERTSRGMCFHCGNPPTPGFKTCAAWRESDRIRHRKYYAKKAA